jgi:hypothetical protein
MTVTQDYWEELAVPLLSMIISTLFSSVWVKMATLELPASLSFKRKLRKNKVTRRKHKN